jgi:exopolysaccharide production protein ExoY
MTLGETRADAPAITADAFAPAIPTAAPRTLADDHVAALVTRPLSITTPGGRFGKRAFDLAIGLPLLLIALPLMLVLALGVVLTSRGPVFFRQQRVARGGRPITIRKLRSMHDGAEDVLRADPTLTAEYRANGYKLNRGRDPRITRFGHFLRRSSLDELPQLFNVVGGSMSLVGPRPVLEHEATTLYGDEIALYHAVKPGLTGMWQVSGRSELSQQERAELDESYVSTWSLWLDFALLARTVPAVVSQRGAH